MKSLKFFAVTLMLWPYLGIALLYLPEAAAPYVFFLLPYSAHMFSEGSSKFQVFLNRKTYGLQKEEMKL